MSMIQVNDLKPGLSFRYENNLFIVLDTLHNKTAMRQMIVKTKVKNLRSGSVIELSFTGGDKVEAVHLDKRPMQLSYLDGDEYVFMDMETFDQVHIHKSSLEWESKFLKENQAVEITYFDSEILGISLPIKVQLRIAQTEPAVKGDTVTKASKDAVLETGHMIRVPLFIEQDEEVIVRTDTGDYDSRAK